jgi:hypothetical protein
MLTSSTLNGVYDHAPRRGIGCAAPDDVVPAARRSCLNVALLLAIATALLRLYEMPNIAIEGCWYLTLAGLSWSIHCSPIIPRAATVPVRFASAGAHHVRAGGELRENVL